MMPEGRTYMASVAGVMASDNEVGKICMLRDISRYKELDTLKSEFVSTVSHDLKTPLSMIEGYANLMGIVGELNTQQKIYSKNITEGIEHMTQLVDDILDLTRFESSVGIILSRVNLIEAIEKIVSIVEPRTKQKNIQLILNETVDSGVFIETDFSMLQRALLNLLENAVKYTPTGGQIEITTQFSEDAVVFEVRDNGMGISPVDVPYIFDKFYRSGDQETIHKRSTGLGLAIVKSIADRLAGRVWVQSKLGKGSTFYLELPLEQEN
jgi:signal transduction histidine kinase